VGAGTLGCVTPLGFSEGISSASDVFPLIGFVAHFFEVGIVAAHEGEVGVGLGVDEGIVGPIHSPWSARNAGKLGEAPVDFGP